MVIMKKVTYNLVIGLLLLFCWSERSSATIHGNSVRNVNYLKKSAPRPIKYFILFHLNIKKLPKIALKDPTKTVKKNSKPNLKV